MKTLYGKKDPGVSPVIATILMVAITVVLAATVYLMVSGYMTGPSKPSFYATLTETQPITNGTSAILSLSMSSPSSVPVANLILHVAFSNGTTISVYSTKYSPTAGTSSTANGATWLLGWSGTSNWLKIVWTAMSGTSTGTIYSGDTFAVTGVSASLTALTGTTIFFSTTVATGTSNTVTMA
jgi:flagellin-like protein